MSDANQLSGGPLRIVPMLVDEANRIVRLWHRHLPVPPPMSRYAIGAVKNGRLVGALLIGRPGAIGTPAYSVAEITRCATDGTRNAGSALYGAAARLCKAAGFWKVQTYNLDDEGGASLRAAGYVRVADVRGREHKRSNGAPRLNANTDDKGRWERVLNPPVPNYALPQLPDSQEALAV